MVQRKIEKTASLILSVFILLMATVYVPDWSLVGVSQSNNDIFARMSYCFFHASFLHAAVNLWCLLSAIFLYNVSWGNMLAAYVIAVLVPPFTLGAIPTVGLSGVCFALLGIVSTRVSNKLFYNVCILLYLLVQLPFPNANVLLHAFSYLAGVAAGLLVMPIPCRRR